MNTIWTDITKKLTDFYKTLQMSGITHAKSTFIVHNICELTAAVKAGTVTLSIEPQETRAKKIIYWLKAKVGEVSNRLYFALPKGSELDDVMDEKPKLVLRIECVEGEPKDMQFKFFEQSYRAFMKECVEPLLKPVVKSESELRLANFSKTEAGVGTKFTMLQLPRGIKPDQIQRLKEARGSHILASISYMYAMDDAEKGIMYYGAIFEAGRYPWTPDTGKPPSAKKRKTDPAEEVASV